MLAAVLRALSRFRSKPLDYDPHKIAYGDYPVLPRGFAEPALALRAEPEGGLVATRFDPARGEE